MDLISIIVPIYKTEKYLRKCLDSISNQTYSNIEVILVNDGSPDNSLEIAEEYVKKDKRFKVYSQENKGLSSARNLGIKKANGNYIGFVDSDDYIKDNMFEYLYNVCIQNNSDMAVCGWFIKNDENIIPCQFKSNLKVLDSEEAIDLLLNHVSFDNFACNKLFKKSLFNDITFPEGKLLEDLLVMYKLIGQSNKVAITSEPLYYYVQHNASITHKLQHKLNKDAFQVFCIRRNNLLKKYPNLKKKINSNFFTANKMYFMISLDAENRDKNFEKDRIKEMRKNVFDMLKDKSIPLKVRITSTLIAFFPYSYFKIRRIVYGKKI